MGEVGEVGRLRTGGREDGRFHTAEEPAIMLSCLPSITRCIPYSDMMSCGR